MMQGFWTYWWNPWLVGAGKESGETESGDAERCLERTTFLGGRECSQQLGDRSRRANTVFQLSTDALPSTGKHRAYKCVGV